MGKICFNDLNDNLEGYNLGFACGYQQCLKDIGIDCTNSHGIWSMRNTLRDIKGSEYLLNDVDKANLRTVEFFLKNAEQILSELEEGRN